MKGYLLVFLIAAFATTCASATAGTLKKPVPANRANQSAHHTTAVTPAAVASSVRTTQATPSASTVDTTQPPTQTTKSKVQSTDDTRISSHNAEDQIARYTLWLAISTAVLALFTIAL